MPGLGRGNGKHRGTGHDQRRLQGHAGFQKPLQAAAVRGTAEYRIECAGGARADQHGSGGIHGQRCGGALAAGDTVARHQVEKFTQSLELETERGDIELTPGTLPLAAIEARSGVGKIELVLPDKSSFQLDATAERGDAVNDYGPPIRKETEGRTTTLKGRVGDGPTIKITSNRGSIEVRKEGTTPSEILPDTPSGKTPKPPMPPKPARNLRDSEVKM